MRKVQQRSYENAKICYICKENLEINMWKKTDIVTLEIRDHCHYTGRYRGAAHSKCNLKYGVSKKISIAFHNGSNYDYHFIIKKLAENLKNNLLVLEETLKNK